VGGFLLDANVPSELTRAVPQVRVSGWVDAQDNASLYLSVVTVVTRNVKDFAGLGVTVFNPWDAG
jgi:predicted nucleic acid-binding protein